MDPFEDLDRRLREAHDRVRWFDHLAARRSSLGRQIREVADLVTELEQQLAKERRDVERLEGGLSAFMARLTGSREERLTRERAEAALAGERLDGQRARLEALTGDLGETERDLAATAGAADDYQRLLSEKERLLVERGDQRGRRLMELSGLMADTQADLREHDEAVQAGKAAGQWVGHVLTQLEHARGASTWDMLGGGVFADAVEREHLVTADQATWQAQQALDTFARELADLGWAVRPKMPEVDTRWFADVFFDNIITDALKHQRINRTRTAVAEMSAWIDDSLRTLAQGQADLTRRLGDLTGEREHLLAT
ncbi:hypothetical protein [Nonomuraea sp. C10]|uniref:hypothetical protein n=1 Tax=Nonomuraea sp. C10 TaxID=2600577 RepID=UPI0011CD95DA|nr:hypothetical protein [Nonomuraea sp. C10]TXK43147.1 hypothetical protein FR742_29405 [Nonomuraea sp. C10]